MHKNKDEKKTIISESFIAVREKSHLKPAGLNQINSVQFEKKDNSNQQAQ